MAKFTIVLAEYVHSPVFHDVRHLLKCGLEALGHEVTCSGWGPPINLLGAHGDETRLLLAPHLFRAALNDDSLLLSFLAPGDIVYNFEPVASRLFEASFPLLKAKDVRVWDYSAQGVEKLWSLGINAHHVPLGYAPEMTRLQPWAPTCDVLFYGSLNERRTQVLAGLRENELNVKHLFGVYGPARDREIELAKLVLNMHYYPSAPTEDVRLTHLIANKICVVSEGPPDDPRKLGWCVWSPYENLVAHCSYLCELAGSARARIGELGFQSFRMGPSEVDILKEALT